MMDEDVALITPDLDEVPEDTDAEPADAYVPHEATADQLELFEKEDDDGSKD